MNKNQFTRAELILFVLREILIQGFTLAIAFGVGWYIADFIVANWLVLALCAAAVLIAFRWR